MQSFILSFLPLTSLESFLYFIAIKEIVYELWSHYPIKYNNWLAHEQMYMEFIKRNETLD